MTLLFLLLALAALVWFWADSMRARERAVRRCAVACKDMNLQLLDQTVGLRRLGLGRNAEGRVLIRRWYGFEFSVSGVNRYKGVVALLGNRIEYLRLEHPDGPIIINGIVNGGA